MTMQRLRHLYSFLVYGVCGALCVGITAWHFTHRDYGLAGIALAGVVAWTVNAVRAYCRWRSVAHITTHGDTFLRKGDRIVFGGHRAAVIRGESTTTLTIAYRDAWYWRVLWRLEDWWVAVRHSIAQRCKRMWPPTRNAPKWMRHHWRTRTVQTPHGVVFCRCAWWRRLWYLAMGR